MKVQDQQGGSMLWHMMHLQWFGSVMQGIAMGDQ
jgi:hypothetical protein